jgi:hypothetical protein
MHLMTISTYPLKSTAQAGKKFVEVAQSPMPDFLKRQAMYTEYGGKGVTAYGIYEVEKGHEDEGVKALVKLITNYYDIDGYEIAIRVVLSVEEALPLIGLEL